MIQAGEFLNDAKEIMDERGKTYDNPKGERSMAATIEAFNAVTGKALTESDGWLIMLLLKQVRQNQKAGFHLDSAQDSVAYAALLAEAQSRAGE